MHFFTAEELAKAQEARRRKLELCREQDRKLKEAEAARLAYALNTMRQPDFYKPKEVAAILGVTPKCVRDWVRKGKLKAQRFYAGSNMRIYPAEVERLRGARGVEGVKEP